MDAGRHLRFDHADRLAQTMVEVGIFLAGSVYIRKCLQVSHDAGNALHPLGAVVEEIDAVFENEVEVQPLPALGKRTRVRFQFGKFAEVFFEGGQVAANEAERIVDLMRHAGRQLADRGEFFRLVEHLLALFQVADLFLDAGFQFGRERFVARFRFNQPSVFAFQGLKVLGDRFEVQG